jgi:hypothetical protein
MLAFLAWANNREFYTLPGLRGPPLEWLAQIEPEQKEEAKGEALLPEPRRLGVAGSHSRKRISLALWPAKSLVEPPTFKTSAPLINILSL